MKTVSPTVQSKVWTRRYGWFFLFLVGGLLCYSAAMREKSRTFAEMKAQLHELEQEKMEALKVQSDLLLQIQSQSDPAWVEMVLKRNLGMVREGQVKVYFHAD